MTSNQIHKGFAAKVTRLKWPGDGTRISQGAPTPEFGAKTDYLAWFSPKTSWKWKKLEIKERVPCAPSWIRQVEVHLQLVYLGYNEC